MTMTKKTVVYDGNPLNLQEGEVISTNAGGDISPLLDQITGLKAQLETLERLKFRAKLLTEHASGKRSALSIHWMEIVDEPKVLDDCSPVSSEPDMYGTVILWEGREDMSDRKSRLHRVLKLASGIRVYQKFVRDGWQDLPNGFEAPKRFFRKNGEMNADVEVSLNAQRDTVIRYR